MSEIGPTEKLVYAVLWTRRNGDNEAWCGYRYLSESTGASNASVKRALSRLVEHGLIERKRRGLGRTNVYSLMGQNDPSGRVRMTHLDGSDRPTEESTLREENEESSISEGLPSSIEQAPKVQNGPNPVVQDLMGYMKTNVQFLDGTEQQNRRYAWLLYQKLLKLKPGAPHEAVETIKALIDTAIQDSFHGPNLTSFRYLFYNAGKIASTAKKKTIRVLDLE